MRKRVLICGCGYVGLALGRLLHAEGHVVYGLRRTTANLAVEGILPLRGDISRPADLRALPGPFDWVVHAASSSGGGIDEYRAVYLNGMRNLLDWLEHSNGQPSRLVYTGSTSVYGHTDGSWVDETSPTEPATETGRILLATEHLLRVAPASVRATILRVSGIYGPGRGHLFRQFVAGKIAPHRIANRWLNMVHRDDVATAIRASLRGDAAGMAYNITDNKPVLAGDFLGWISKQLDAPPAFAGIELTVARPSKRAETDKRVSNRLIRETLRWNPSFPTFREGYADAIRTVNSGGFAR